jgi:hypothetical protein
LETDDRSSAYWQMLEIVKYLVLAESGGICFDAGLQCHHSLEPLLDDIELFWACELKGFISGVEVAQCRTSKCVARQLEHREQS